MPKKWVTAEQEKWLRERLPLFVESHRCKTTMVFYSEVHKEWRKNWPHRNLTNMEITAIDGNVEKAVKEIQSKTEDRVIAWFHNHNRSIVSSRGTRGTIKLDMKPRKKQPWQAYQRMTYETQWKDVIDKAYDELRAEWKPKAPGDIFNLSRFEFMNDFMRKKYEEQSPEVKAKVEEFRQQKYDLQGLSSAEKQQQ
ncbi:hypothetical protein HYPSUDRAFT_147224 [Hypholoma sublateritium FD-334 SS-4]|uniref:Uncharacterized protein n=1 Tax=Hypholoma sublateritium (strain FD-334 SS-4) TaxID=945553 RepID=A0A0D2KQB2_HYPSF|nr:hypothetical protein HYPSUDRAFT_147224 [Hypholoma sublateritium FD-334 SS-4]